MSQNKQHVQKVRMDKIERTPNGFLRIPAYLTRTGVFKYIMKDGSVLRELRHPDDVFRPESIATLKAVPLTNEHPKKLIDPTDAKKTIIGWIGDNVEQDMIYLKADVNVIDAASIADIESGKQELSCGYTSDLVTEKGVYNGEIYDCRQTNIVYNHVSLVKRGRAGAQVKLHLDEDDALEFIEDSTNSDEGEFKMAKIKIGDQDYEVSAETKDAFEKFEKKNKEEMDGLKKAMNDMMPKAEGEKMKGKCDALETEVAQLKAKVDSTDGDKTKFDAAVKARVELVATAKKVLKPEVQMDAMSDIEIKKAVVVAKYPTAKLDGKCEIYVQAMYDQATVEAAKDTAAQDALNKKTAAGQAGSTQTDDAPVSSADARKKMIADSMGAWKQKSENK